MRLCVVLRLRVRWRMREGQLVLLVRPRLLLWRMVLVMLLRESGVLALVLVLVVKGVLKRGGCGSVPLERGLSGGEIQRRVSRPVAWVLALTILVWMIRIHELGHAGVGRDSDLELAFRAGEQRVLAVVASGSTGNGGRMWNNRLSIERSATGLCVIAHLAVACMTLGRMIFCEDIGGGVESHGWAGQTERNKPDYLCKSSTARFQIPSEA